MTTHDDALPRLAIVGMSGRFPGAPDLATFWHNLVTGVDAIERVPHAELRARGVPQALLDDPRHVPAAPALADIAGFDAEFFGLSPREAERIDPQHRLFLECAYEALEEAGHAALPRDALVGVYASSLLSTYLLHNLHGQPVADPGDADLRALASLLGNEKDYLATRTAYKLDLRGPCLAVQTACSSSLVAVHMACQALLAYQCDLALAGGACVRVPTRVGYIHEAGGLHSRDGRCRAFAADADGTVFGDGVGVVALKRLDDALAAGDRIHAVVLATAINNDGAGKAGFTAPAVDGQARVILDALAVADLDPATLDYVEAHGTGTPLGDPIEIAALTRALGDRKARGRSCVIGSVKTNIGHAGPAAGVAGLIKSALSLAHAVLPPSLHFERPNPRIDFARSGFLVNTLARPWSRSRGPRRAGVSSFGIGGTNAHALLEEAPTREPADATADAPQPPFILPLSARHPAALTQLAAQLAALTATPRTPAELVAIAHTAARRRVHHPHRIAVTGSTAAELSAALRAHADGASAPDLARGHHASARPAGPVFVFPGQGAVRPGLCRELRAHEPAFRDAFDRCDHALRPHLGGSLLGALDLPDADPRWRSSALVQPLMFAVQVALAALWRAHGVHPVAVVGHSQGEIAAAHVAGGLDLADAARIIAVRAQLVVRCRGGLLLAELTRDAAEALQREHPVTLAAHNSPRSVALAGELTSLDELARALAERDIFTRRIAIEYASHSAAVDPILPELRAGLAGLVPRPLAVPMRSSVTAELVGDDELGPDYWVRNLRAPVRFADACARLLADGHAPFIELSPHPLLTPAIRECGHALDHELHVIPTLHRDVPDRLAFRRALARAHVAGCELAWDRLYPGTRLAAALPSYPWQRARHWIDAPTAGPRLAPAAWPGLHIEPASASNDHLWQLTLTPDLPLLAEHRVDGQRVAPAALLIELAAAAARSVLPDAALELRDLDFLQPLLVGDAGEHTAQIELLGLTGGGASLRVSSRQAGEPWVLHARGLVHALPPGPPPAPTPGLRQALQARCPQRIAGADHYAATLAHGIDYGPSFRGLVQIWRGDDEALAELRRPADAAPPRLALDPGLLDAALQTLAHTRRADAPLAVPAHIARLRIHRPLEPAGWVHARRSADGPRELVGDLLITAEGGAPLLEINGLTLRCLASDRADALPPAYTIAWHPAALPPAAPAPARILVLGPLCPLGHTLLTALRDHGHVCRHHPDLDLHPDLLDGPVDAVLVLALTGEPAAQTTLAGLHAAHARGLAPLLTAVQRLLTADLDPVPRLWVLTRGVEAVDAPGPATLAHATLPGFLRALEREHPELRPTHLDLDPGAPDPGALIRELALDDPERVLAHRHGQRHVARLVPVRREHEPDTTPRPSRGRAFAVETDRPGTLDALRCVALGRPPLAPDQLEIDVHAAGLNFIDVLQALGTYPGQAPGPLRLGGEGSGRVRARGSAVTDLAVGDPVIFVAPGGLASRVRTARALVAPCPAHLDLDAAAGVPVAFMTAWHALHELARLRPGETVLIHSAASGTGRAALHVARLLGAVPLATAGTPARREQLRALGVACVGDSRDLEFAAEVLAHTRGRGVDVVLNSLAGAAIDASLALLAPGGRFIEIGKRDVFADRPLGLRGLRRNQSLAVVDLAELGLGEPARFAALFADVIHRFADHQLEPLPVEPVPIARAADAFWTLARGEHRGKLVLTTDAPPAQLHPPARGSAAIRCDARYLVTGGLGGLGLAVAAWLVEHGARHLTLLGRGAPDPAAQAALADLRARGATLELHQLDVADPTRLRAALDLPGPPLAGVIHAAGQLADVSVLAMTPGHLQAALAAKLDGAWNLHEATKAHDLDFFVLFGSLVGVLGAPGQANYAAGNAFLDRLAQHRRALGLPAVCLDWGPWQDIGQAANLGAPQPGALRPARGLAALDAWMTQGRPQVLVLELEPDAWPASADPLRSALRPAATPAAHGSLVATLRSLGPGEARAQLEQHLLAQLAAVLKLASPDLDPRTPLTALGLDSLLALELRNRLEASLGLRLSATMTWRHPTPAALALALATALALASPDPATTPTPTPTPTPPPTTTPDDAAAALDRELAEIADLLQDDPR